MGLSWLGEVLSRPCGTKQGTDLHHVEELSVDVSHDGHRIPDLQDVGFGAEARRGLSDEAETGRLGQTTFLQEMLSEPRDVREQLGGVGCAGVADGEDLFLREREARRWDDILHDAVHFWRRGSGGCLLTQVQGMDRFRERGRHLAASVLAEEEVPIQVAGSEETRGSRSFGSLLNRPNDPVRAAEMQEFWKFKLSRSRAKPPG